MRVSSSPILPPNLPNASIVPCLSIPRSSSVLENSILSAAPSFILTATNDKAPTKSVLTRSENSSTGTSNVFAKTSGDAAICLSRLLIAVAPRSGLIASSASAVESPNILSVEIPSGTAVPEIRLTNSAMVGAVAAPCASKKLSALPSFNTSPETSSVLKSVNTLRSPAITRVISSTPPN